MDISIKIVNIRVNLCYLMMMECVCNHFASSCAIHKVKKRKYVNSKLLVE